MKPTSRHIEIPYYSTSLTLYRWYAKWAAENNRPPVKRDNIITYLKRHKVPMKEGENGLLYFLTRSAKYHLKHPHTKGQTHGEIIKNTPRPEGHATLGDLFQEANDIRTSQGYPPYANPSCLYGQLKRYNCPTVTTKVYNTDIHFYHRETALNILTTCKKRVLASSSDALGVTKIHPFLPKEHWYNPCYMTIRDCAEKLNSPITRLQTAVGHLNVPAFIHPKTKKLVVHVQEAYNYLTWHNSHRIRKLMGDAGVEAIRGLITRLPNKRKRQGYQFAYNIPELIYR